jgi:hypothetical protein
MEKMQDCNRESEETSSEHKNEHADRVDRTDNDRYKVAHNLEYSQFEQLCEKKKGDFSGQDKLTFSQRVENVRHWIEEQLTK